MFYLSYLLDKGFLYEGCDMAFIEALCRNKLNITDLHIDGLVQDCSNSIASALEILQSYIKPLIYETSIQDSSQSM